MRKKRVNAAIFFTILLWLAVYFLVIKYKLVFKEQTAVSWVVIAGVNLVIILSARFLVPAFELILKGTGKIGAFIFGVVSTLVYFFILTPIALFKRLTGQKQLEAEIEKEKESYYEKWEPSVNIKKQY